MKGQLFLSHLDSDRLNVWFGYITKACSNCANFRLIAKSPPYQKHCHILSYVKVTNYTNTGIKIKNTKIITWIHSYKNNYHMCLCIIEPLHDFLRNILTCSSQKLLVMLTILPKWGYWGYRIFQYYSWGA